MKRSPEIEAIVRRFYAAREKGDVEVGSRLWSRTEHLISVGTAEHDWHFDTSELAGLTEAHWSEAPAEKIDLLRLFAFEHGEIGWAVTEQRRTDLQGRAGVFRQTLVFELEAGAWKIVHNHFSVPVPDLDVWGVDLTRTLSALVDSAGTGTEFAANASGTSTLLFTDVVDSTQISLQLGEQEWSQLIMEHFEAVREVVEVEGGVVVKTLGDGGMYAFDSGSSALRAAEGIQRVVGSDSDPELKVRVGVHTGDVVRAGGDYLGAAVAKAARVAAAAQGGQILVSSTTAGLVSAAEFEFGAPINVEIKGLSGTHQLHELKWS